MTRANESHANPTKKAARLGRGPQAQIIKGAARFRATRTLEPLLLRRNHSGLS